MQGDRTVVEEAAHFGAVGMEGDGDSAARFLVENFRAGGDEACAQGRFISSIAERVGGGKNDGARLDGGEEFSGGEKVVAVAPEQDDIGAKMALIFGDELVFDDRAGIGHEQGGEGAGAEAGHQDLVIGDARALPGRG